MDFGRDSIDYYREGSETVVDYIEVLTYYIPFEGRESGEKSVYALGLPIFPNWSRRSADLSTAFSRTSSLYRDW